MAPVRKSLGLLAVALTAIACLLTLVPTAQAVDYRVEVIDEPAPSEGIAPEMHALLAPTGVRVIRGSSRIVCEMWLCKQWAMGEALSAKDIIYPFQFGQLIGVARYVRKAADFRDQEILDGLYTMRYSLQPVDGDHVGTSNTRDFLLLLEAKADRSAKLMKDEEELNEYSSEAAGTSHPALLSMLRIEKRGEPTPSIRHDEENDWWIVRMASKAANKDGKTQALAFELVVVGYADE